MHLWLSLSAVFLAPAVFAQSADSVWLPTPTGPHTVGTTTWHWVDATRPDTLTPAPDDVRQVMAQLWYPAAPAPEAERAPYAPLYPHLSFVQAWSVPSAPVAPGVGPLPVVVFAPGRGVARHFYTSHAEDLASHGYAVLAVDSPHSGRVRYPDGRYVRPTSKYQIPFEVLTGPYEHVDAFFAEAAELGGDDLRFALDRLAAVNGDDPAHLLTGHLDLSRMGLYGHSLGGRIGGGVVAMDPRFKAYVAMESVPPRAARRAGLDAAVLKLMSRALPEMAHPNIREVIPNRRNDVFITILDGYGHNSISDLAYLDPDYGYEIDPAEAIATSRTLLLSFFDQYVREQRGAMADTGSLPHVDLETHPALADRP